MWFKGWFIGQAYFLADLEQPVVGPFAVVVAEDLWFTGWFIGQAYFLAGLEHPVVGPFAVVAVVVVEDLIANWTSYFLQT
jgi:hypothetical protein